MHKKEVLSQPWTNTVEEILESLDVSRLEGLNPHQVRSMRGKYGRNRLREAEKKGIVEILIAQFKSLIVILLGVAGVLSFAFHEYMDGFAILGVIFINAARYLFFNYLEAFQSSCYAHAYAYAYIKIVKLWRQRGDDVSDITTGQIW